MARSAADQQKLDAHVVALQKVLAPDRLAAYRPAAADDLVMVSTYFWNAALSRDFHLILGAVAVSMRNGIHGALSAHAGRDNWYDRVPLLKREADAVAEMKTEIGKSGKAVIPGRVVAGLGFGFWTGPLSAGFGPTGYGAALWSPSNAALIKTAFSYLDPTNQNRGFVHGRFNTLRLLRNRTSHHEPIWRGMTSRNGTTFPLADLYANALDSIGWVSQELQASIVAYDRFPGTLQDGVAAQEAAIKAHLGIS